MESGQAQSADDVGLLRSAASNNKALRTHAVHLSRRLAPNVMVNDLGVVEVLVGSEPVDRPIRRKVLGLLCFLLSRTNMAAARDEALDALWPDLGPHTASNSLHQTIFFLRRVFEPGFREGYGVAYVHFDGDVVSLNPDLIDSASRRCWRLLAETRRTGQDVLHELLECYAGRFALDFAYEDWATNYRDTLHAAVLSAIERAITESSRVRDHERTIWLARAALLLDPSADSVELALVRAYKASERRAAAAEQYAHYSTVLREQLAIEPLPFEDL